MTNILQDGATWLGGQLKDHAGLTVTYQRGANTVTITATATMYQYDVVDTEGFNLTALSRDYIVHAADLVIGGSEITPRAGDRIVEVIRGESRTFEVMPLGQIKEFEPLDSDGVLLKIHTKRIT